jgi:hypothetical protein
VSVTEGNAGLKPLVFTVTRTGDTSAAASVDYFSSNNTATGGLDYQPVSGTLNFLPGQATKIVVVQLIGDTAVEPNEAFFLNLAAPGNVAIADNQGVGTITNDDSPTPTPTPTATSFRVNDVAVTEGNGGTKNLSFIVTRSGSTSGTSTVKFNTSDGTAGSGDYVAKTATLSFGPGVTTRTVNVTVKGDTKVEPDETFFLNLSQATGASIADNRGTGTIRNDDQTQPQVFIDVNDESDFEGTSGLKAITFKVWLDRSSGATVKVNFATANGTAGSGDYQSTAGTITFAPGQTQKTITVYVKGDTNSEADETFFVNLTSPVNAAIGDGQGRGIIRNDD